MYGVTERAKQRLSAISQLRALINSYTDVQGVPDLDGRWLYSTTVGPLEGVMPDAFRVLAKYR